MKNIAIAALAAVTLSAPLAAQTTTTPPPPAQAQQPPAPLPGSCRSEDDLHERPTNSSRRPIIFADKWLSAHSAVRTCRADRHITDDNNHACWVSAGDASAPRSTRPTTRNPGQQLSKRLVKGRRSRRALQQGVPARTDTTWNAMVRGPLLRSLHALYHTATTNALRQHPTSATEQPGSAGPVCPRGP